MNITEPEKCTYLEEAADRRMSYSRQKSLSRAVSYRQTLLKKSGDLADSQYTDQYLDRETVMNTLRKQHSGKRNTIDAVSLDAADALGRCAPEDTPGTSAGTWPGQNSVLDHQRSTIVIIAPETRLLCTVGRALTWLHSRLL
jgi:hypothetical protein